MAHIGKALEARQEGNPEHAPATVVLYRQALLIEKIISFMPYQMAWPPSYKYAYQSDPPQFKNPFAWDGASARQPYNPIPAREERAPGCHPGDKTGTFEEEETELK